MQAVLKQKIIVIDRAEMILGKSNIFHQSDTFQNMFQMFSKFLSEALRHLDFEKHVEKKWFFYFKNFEKVIY